MSISGIWISKDNNEVMVRRNLDGGSRFFIVRGRGRDDMGMMRIDKDVDMVRILADFIKVPYADLLVNE